MRTSHRSGTAPRLQGERGTVLFVVMIALVVMMVSGLAMFRSVDTSILLSGNFAFRKAATHAADLGIEAAAAELPNIINTSQDTLLAQHYYPSLMPSAGGLLWDGDGLPPTSVWTGAQSVASAPAGYTIAYIIERLCTGALPVANILANCVADPAPDTSSSKSGSVKFTASSALYYRVTVRVAGPHNTVSFVQAMLSK